MEFLCTPLPEAVVDCEKQGRFKLAEEKIELYLKKEIPELLRKRLEYELYRITRIRKNYKYNSTEALQRLKSQVKDITDDEFQKLVTDKRLDFVTFEGERYFERRF